MTHYLSITPGEPFDFGKDEAHRCVYAVPVEAYKKYSDTFHKELVKVLADAGVGVPADSLFTTSNVTVPEGAGPYILILVAPGSGTPNRCKGEPLANSLVRPRARILVFAKQSEVASSTAHAVYRALLAVRNVDVEAAA